MKYTFAFIKKKRITRISRKLHVSEFSNYGYQDGHTYRLGITTVISTVLYITGICQEVAWGFEKLA